MPKKFYRDKRGRFISHKEHLRRYRIKRSLKKRYKRGRFISHKEHLRRYRIKRSLKKRYKALPRIIKSVKSFPKKYKKRKVKYLVSGSQGLNWIKEYNIDLLWVELGSLKNDVTDYILSRYKPFRAKKWSGYWRLLFNVYDQRKVYPVSFTQALSDITDLKNRNFIYEYVSGTFDNMIEKQDSYKSVMFLKAMVWMVEYA